MPRQSATKLTQEVRTVTLNGETPKRRIETAFRAHDDPEDLLKRNYILNRLHVFHTQKLIWNDF